MRQKNIGGDATDRMRIYFVEPMRNEVEGIDVTQFYAQLAPMHDPEVFLLRRCYVLPNEFHQFQITFADRPLERVYNDRPRSQGIIKKRIFVGIFDGEPKIVKRMIAKSFLKHSKLNFVELFQQIQKRIRARELELQ